MDSLGQFAQRARGIGLQIFENCEIGFVHDSHPGGKFFQILPDSAEYLKAFTLHRQVNFTNILKIGGNMKIFTQHPASVGENYVQHMGSALSFALPLLGAFLACLVHALLPFLFAKTGSRIIVRLHDRMVTHRHRHAAQAAQTDQAI